MRGSLTGIYFAFLVIALIVIAYQPIIDIMEADAINIFGADQIGSSSMGITSNNTSPWTLAGMKIMGMVVLALIPFSIFLFIVGRDE